MSFDADHDLADFVRRFLTTRGAEIEAAGSRFNVLLPTELAGRLGIPEFCTLNLAGEGQGDVTVQYGRPVLEKMTDAACQRVPFTGLRLNFTYLKSQGFDNLVREQFSFFNGVVAVSGSAATLTDYIVLVCRYLLQSDEQKEDLLMLAFNLETGAPTDAMAALLDTVEKRPEPVPGAAAIGADQLERIQGWVQRRAPVVLEPHLSPFRDSMNRRYQRDVANLEAYYAGLKTEMEAALTRPGLSEDSIQGRIEKMGLLSGELSAKKEDLFKKYSITVQLRLCAALLVRSPAVKVLAGVAVGRAKKQLTFFYNPVLKALDPVVCAGCGQAAYQIQFCTRLHLLCRKCAQACPICR